MSGRLLGIDHGLKRIGLAVSDASGLVARELAVIQRTTHQRDFERLLALAAQEQVSGLVVGLPTNSEALPGEYTAAERVRAWAERLRPLTPLLIIFWDEQLTSVDAREISIRKGRSPRDPIDDLAARVMLQSYLDAVQSGLAAPFPHDAIE